MPLYEKRPFYCIRVFLFASTLRLTQFWKESGTNVESENSQWISQVFPNLLPYVCMQSVCTFKTS